MSTLGNPGHAKKKPELVMPAGTLEKLTVACAYGADAVYAGMPEFSLRARTNSFTEAQLAEGIQYAHERGVKVYLTLNIFARNNRIQASLDALRAAIRFQPDAVVMSDPGLIIFARQEFPHLALYLSTQSNTMNWAAVKLMYDLSYQPITVAHPGGKPIFIFTESEIKPFSILRITT